jgi:hypothetical protein
VVKSIAFDTEGFDGISLLVRGDGNRYKVVIFLSLFGSLVLSIVCEIQFRLKPADQGSSRNEFQYQAAFNTDPAGAWRRIHLPFESFVSVKRNDVDYAAPKVQPTSLLCEEILILLLDRLIKAQRVAICSLWDWSSLASTSTSCRTVNVCPARFSWMSRKSDCIDPSDLQSYWFPRPAQRGVEAAIIDSAVLCYVITFE